VKTFGTLRYVAPRDDFFAIRRGLWHLQANADVMIRLKRMFPRAATNRSAFITLEDTTEICRDLEWTLDRWPLEIDEADWARLRARAEEHREREETVLQILSGERPHLPGLVEPARPGREYQLTAADLALTTGRLLLADDLGLGKSMSALLTLRDPERLPALIVCPTHLPRQWEDELAKTLPLLRAHHPLRPAVRPAKRASCAATTPTS
jgi:SNF2 family DNA or RNA helicase